MDWSEGKGGGSLENAVVDGMSVTAGFIGSGLLGTEIEKRVKVVTASSPMTDKLMAYGINNLPKVVVYYLLDMMGSGHEIDVAKLGVTGNIMTDTLVRASNKGVNNGLLFGYNILERSRNVRSGVQPADVQRLIQENSGLRTELNKALQRLAVQPKAGQIRGAEARQVQAAPIVYVQPVQQVQNPLQVPNTQARNVQAQQAHARNMQAQAHAQQAQAHARMQAQQVQSQQVQAQQVQAQQSRMRAQQAQPVRSQPVISVAPVMRSQVPPVIDERERKFGFMGEEEDRRRKYGAMPTYDAPVPVKGRERKYGFMEQEKEIIAAFGML